MSGKGKRDHSTLRLVGIIRIGSKHWQTYSEHGKFGSKGEADMMADVKENEHFTATTADTSIVDS